MCLVWGAHHGDVLDALLGVGCGLARFYGIVWLGRPISMRELGLRIPLSLPRPWGLAILAMLVAAATIAGCVPARPAYRLSLADGLSIRV